MVQQMLSWQILRQCQPVSTAVCSRMHALITIGSSARFMLSGCRNVPDHPFKRPNIYSCSTQVDTKILFLDSTGILFHPKGHEWVGRISK